MQTVTTIAQTMLRFCGLTQLALGLLLWTGRARGMIAVHMLLGFVLAIALWTLALLAIRTGVDVALVAAALLWGLLVASLALTQSRPMAGHGQWLVPLAHLLVSLAAIRLGDVLTARARGASNSHVAGRDQL